MFPPASLRAHNFRIMLAVATIAVGIVVAVLATGIVYSVIAAYREATDRYLDRGGEGSTLLA